MTIGASGQGMVAGDLVNVAARLQSRAPAAGVLVDEATRDLASDAATYEAVGTMALKGRSGRIAAFRATPRSGADDVRSGGAHRGPFIGRDGELRELIGLYESSAREAQCRLVSVTGIAGIGKSRLAWEFGEWIERLPDDVAWHVGHARAYGDAITFAPLAEMVRRRIRVSDLEPPSVARRQLAATMTELVSDEVERAWMEPRIATLLDRDQPDAFERDELFAAWRRFFERVSERTPAVLVFEDLQWADTALLDFIDHLATWAREHPILVVTLARPELLDRRPAWGAGMPRSTSIRLERLADDDMRALLGGRAPDLADGMVEAILARAGGVPLYAVEVVRILAEPERRGGRRRDERREGRPGAVVEVPDSLAGLISARIDAVPAAERRLLLSAAVLGSRFRPEELAAISGTDPAVVRERVEALVRRDLLTLDDEIASPGRGGISFVQDLVRDVASRTLGHADRRALHLAAARYLESTDREGASEALARHLVEAHRLAPDHPDALRVARRAVAALRAAARDAQRIHVPDRALGHLETALTLAGSPEERAAVLEEAAAAARAAAQLSQAERFLRELIELRRDGPEAAKARAQLASVLLMAQRNEPALVELESAIAAVDDAESDPAGVELIAQLARARLLVGDEQAGLGWAEQATEAAERLGLGGVAVDAHVTHGTALVVLGEVEVGIEELERAIETARRDGFLSAELRARNNLAWLAVADDPRVTLETARRGFELAQVMGVGDMAVQLGEVACAAALDTGDWEWALATTDELLSAPLPEANRLNLIADAAVIGALAGDRSRLKALDGIEPLPPETDAQVAAGIKTARAWISLVGGRLDEARDLAAAAALESLGADRFHALIVGARASVWAGDREGAAAALSEAEETQLTGRAKEAALETLRAGVAALDGDNDPAAFERAADGWRRLELPTQLALCLIDAARLVGLRTEELPSVIAELGARGLRGLVPRARTRR